LSKKLATSTEQQARFPADSFRGGPQFFEGSVLDLADALLADAEQVADLAEAVGAVAGQAEAEVEDLALAGPEVLHQEVQGFLAFGVLADRGAFVVRHRLGQFEIAVVVQDGVEGDWCAGGRLEMGEMFEAAAGAGGEFLRAGKVFAAVGEGFGFLLKEAEFLQVMRRKADEMALTGDGDLQGLADPPGRVGGEPSAVADVEAVDGCMRPQTASWSRSA
jgi:hypothetical protein